MVRRASRRAAPLRDRRRIWFGRPLRLNGPDERASHEFAPACRLGGNDVVDDVLGIPSHTSHQRRAQRVEEGKPDEVETGTGLDDAPIVNGNAVVGWQREIDPVDNRV